MVSSLITGALCFCCSINGPNSLKSWDAVQNRNKTECDNVQIFFDIYSIGNKDNTIFMNLMPATCLKRAETGTTKDWESSGMLQ